MTGDIDNIRMVLGSMNIMMILDMPITRASLTRFREERFRDKISRNKFYQAMRYCITKGYITEGENVRNASTLHISDTGRLVMAAGTIQEVAHIVSKQSGGTCVAHATAKAATQLLQGDGWVVDFNQVLCGFLSKLTLTQIEEGVHLDFFNRKKILVKLVGESPKQTNTMILMKVREVTLEEGKQDNAAMIVTVFTGEWLAKQVQRAGPGGKQSKKFVIREILNYVFHDGTKAVIEILEEDTLITSQLYSDP